MHYGFDAHTADGGYSNTGEFGNLYYTGTSAGNAHTTPGVLGDALALDGSGDFVTSGRGHVIEGETRTVAAWVKLTAGGAETVVSYGGRRTGLNGRFLFRLNGGRPELDVAPGVICRPASAPAVNDGRWHHVAVVLPGDHVNRCAELRFYVDGQTCGLPLGQAELRTLPWANIRIGVDERGNGGFFNGLIDDVAIWHAALTPGQVRSLHQAAVYDGLWFDASQMDELFDLYESQGEPRVVAGREWRFADDLQGAAGDIAGAGDNYTIQFDSTGGGVATGSDTPVTPYVTGGVEVATGAADLTAEGTVDWLHAGLYAATSINRKASGHARIGPLETLGRRPQRYEASRRLAYRWTDGSPTAVADTHAGVWVPGIGNGFQITLPADLTPRRAVAYLGGYRAEGLLDVSLSGTDARWRTTLHDFGGPFDRRIVIDYRVGVDDAVLTLSYTMTAGDGNVTFQAVALQGEASNRPPEIDPISARTVEAGDTLSLAVHAADPDGPPPLEMAATGLPDGAAFTDLGAGDCLLEWTPTADAASTTPYAIVFTARDGEGLTDEATAYITVVAGGYGGLDVDPLALGAVTHDLSVLGETDWKHFGLTDVTSVNRKAGVPDQIGGYTPVGVASALRYSGNATYRQSAAWDDGTPRVSHPGTPSGLYFKGQGAGYTLSLPAGVSERTAHLLLGGWKSSARLEVELGDGSASPAVARFENRYGVYDRLVVIRYRAAADGQTLRIRYVAEAVYSGGNVTLSAVALTGEQPPQVGAMVVDPP